jgi:hypothetical protein
VLLDVFLDILRLNVGSLQWLGPMLPRPNFLNFIVPNYSFCWAKKNILVPNLLFIGSQEGVKKIWSKNWNFHCSKVVDREKYSL